MLRDDVDTQGGNCGSPVIVSVTETAIGIHTNGGCSAAGGTNTSADKPVSRGAGIDPG